MSKSNELILHIGHFKTGTTALQIFFEHNRVRLARGGLVYARTLLRNSKHSPLAFAVLRDAGITSLIYGFKNPRTAHEIWQDLFAEARALPIGQSLLVSSEEFMRIGGHPDAADLMRDILGSAPDIRVRVIAYLRPPQAHLRSWYNQMIKLGHPVSDFDTAVTTQFEVIHWDYARALKPWIDMLGPEAVTLRGFSDALREGDALYRDCVEALGSDLPWLSIRPLKDPNPRLDDRLLPLRRALTDGGFNAIVAERIMSRATEALASQELRDNGPDFARIRARCEQAIAELSRLPHAGFDPRLLLDDLPHETGTPDGASEAIIGSLLAEIKQLQNTRRKPGGGGPKQGQKARQGRAPET